MAWSENKTKFSKIKGIEPFDLSSLGENTKPFFSILLLARQNKNMEDKIILLGSTFHHLRSAIAENFGIRTENINLKIFEDGEIKPIIPADLLENKKVFYIHSTYSPAQNVWEFILTIDAFKRLKKQPQSINLIIPYFGYARQDRADIVGTPVSLEVLASFVPSNFNFTTVDLHNPKTISFFKCSARNILPAKDLALFLKNQASQFLAEAQIVSPDKGAREKAELLYSQLNLSYPLIQINKKRDPITGNVEILGIEGEIKAKNVIIWDDVFTSGRTILGEIDYLKKRGVEKVIFIVTHPLFFKVKLTKLPEILEKVEMLVTTDSIQVPSEGISSKIKVVSLLSFLKEII